jgi:hypothetical protein
LTFPNPTSTASTNSKIFYGWYIVAVGFLAQVNCAFHMSSTLNIFLKPLTEDLAVSGGVFSPLRSREILLPGALAPFFGFVHDVTGSYRTSSMALVPALGFSALLSIAVRPPQIRTL